MLSGLTPRRQNILKIIISEYVTTAVPVASESILRNNNLGVSSATIRNDMVFLESEGYIGRPHTSAGCVPLAKGYRFYVESLTSNLQLSSEEQNRIRKSFQKVEEVDRWLKLAAALVSRFAGNAALVTFPQAAECKFKHVELVSLHEFLALLVLVLSDAVLKQQLLSFDKPVTQEQLTGITDKLNAGYAGLTTSGITTSKLKTSAEEKRVTDAVTDIMTSEDEMKHGELYFEGLRLMLEQPEFVDKERMLHIMELMEASDWLKPMLGQQSDTGGVQVLIGEESHDAELKDLSLVLRRYGVPHKVGGTIGVIGPTRMDYRRTISTVDYVSEILSYLISGVCRKD
jgi:heat-inducible transcriptional repressor